MFHGCNTCGWLLFHKINTKIKLHMVSSQGRGKGVPRNHSVYKLNSHLTKSAESMESDISCAFHTEHLPSSPTPSLHGGARAHMYVEVEIMCYLIPLTL